MAVHYRLGPHTSTVLLNYDTEPPRNHHQIYIVVRTFQGLGEGSLLLVTVFDNGLVRLLKKKTIIYIEEPTSWLAIHSTASDYVHYQGQIDSTGNILRIRCWTHVHERAALPTTNWSLYLGNKWLPGLEQTGLPIARLRLVSGNSTPSRLTQKQEDPWHWISWKAPVLLQRGSKRPGIGCVT